MRSPILCQGFPCFGFFFFLLGAIRVRDTRLFLGMGVRLRYLGFLKLDILNPLPPTSSIRYSWGIHLVRCMDFRSPESLGIWRRCAYAFF